MPHIIYASQEEIPENARQHAQQLPNGTFQVDATPLLTNYKELLRENHNYRSAAQKLKQFGDIDPEQARRAIEDFERVEQFNRDVSKAIEAKEREWQAREAR